MIIDGKYQFVETGTTLIIDFEGAYMGPRTPINITGTPDRIVVCTTKIIVWQHTTLKEIFQGFMSIYDLKIV